MGALQRWDPYVCDVAVPLQLLLTKKIKFAPRQMFSGAITLKVVVLRVRMALSSKLLGMEQTTRWCRRNNFITKCFSFSQSKLPVKRPHVLHVHPLYGGVLVTQPRAPLSEPWGLDVGLYNPSGSARHPPGSCSKAAEVGTRWSISPALPEGLEWWIWIQSCQTPRTTCSFLPSRSSHPLKPQQSFALQARRQIAPGVPGDLQEDMGTSSPRGMNRDGLLRPVR